MNKVGTWIGKMLSEADGTPSTKRMLFVLAVVSCLAFVAGYLLKKNLDQNVVDLAKTILYTTGGAYGLGRYAEQKDALYGKKEPDGPAT